LRQSRRSGCRKFQSVPAVHDTDMVTSGS
jgi:hypothetical protein